MSQAIIALERVSKSFRGRSGATLAVDDVSLEIDRGEIFGVIGHSGAGKSTLVRLINALERADSGRIVVNGHDVTSLGERQLRSLRSDVGMIFQHFNLFAARTVLANVAYPLLLARWPKARRVERAMELLEFVGIADKAKAHPAQLSGGQKQRVGIARALAASPSILLADEATSALDPETTSGVMDLLRRVNRELGVTLVIITHDMRTVQHVCDRVAVMADGAVVEAGPTYRMLAQGSHPVTRRFVQSALHDRPSRAALERLRAARSGRLAVVTLAESGPSGFEWSAPLAGLDVRAEVVFGAIVEVEERPFGSLTVCLDGPDAEPALARLAGAGWRVTDLGTPEAPRQDPIWGQIRELGGES